MKKTICNYTDKINYQFYLLMSANTQSKTSNPESSYTIHMQFINYKLLKQL